MDQRRSKTITILLLLAIIAMTGLFIWSNLKVQGALESERQATIGVLAKEEIPEAQLIAAFTQEPTPEVITKGMTIEEKYGFMTRPIRQQEILNTVAVRNAVILSGSILLLLSLFIWHLREKQKLERKFVQLIDAQQAEKTQYELLLKRTRKEDGNIKSSITDIAHQLKTPVASLKLSLDIALSDSYSDQERKEFSQQAEVQINKLDLMLDGLVKISQLETDLIQLEPQTLSLKEVINEAINGVIMKAIEKEIEIEVSTICDEKIFIDRKWTLEAIGNVLENAVKYSPTQTTIKVRCTSLITYVLVEIIDEGPGISKQEINRIYHRFYRGEQSDAIEGSGVGLYLARKIIEGQGGAIMVKSQQPRGSNFQLTFPLS